MQCSKVTKSLRVDNSIYFLISNWISLTSNQEISYDPNFPQKIERYKTKLNIYHQLFLSLYSHCISCGLLPTIQPTTAPPEITVEKSWIHAAEGYDADLVCIVHGDVNSEVRCSSILSFLFVPYSDWLSVCLCRCFGTRTHSCWIRLTDALCTLEMTDTICTSETFKHLTSVTTVVWQTMLSVGQKSTLKLVVGQVLLISSHLHWVVLWIITIWHGPSSRFLK